MIYTDEEAIYFAVVGKSSYPEDMERHDRAKPIDEANVAKAQNREYVDGREIPRVVILKGHPTPARWGSFGWSIIEQSWDLRNVQAEAKTWEGWYA